MITGLYAGLLALVLAALVLAIVMRRWKYKVGLGDGGIVDLQQRIRAHGNFTETVPILLIIMMILENNGAPVYVLHAYGIGILMSRLLHAGGLYSSPATSIGRLMGTILTVTLMIAGAAMVILDYLF